MKFLKTLLWLGFAVLLGILAAWNWRDVTINLWGDLQADIKIPVLMLLVWLLGFLPAWLIYRLRDWSSARRGPVVAPTDSAAPDRSSNGDEV